jgi:hypothetical protein
MRMPLVPAQVASCSTLLHTALRSPFPAVLVYFFSFGWNRLTGSPQGWPKKPRSVFFALFNKRGFFLYTLRLEFAETSEGHGGDG